MDNVAPSALRCPPLSKCPPLDKSIKGKILKPWYYFEAFQVDWVLNVGVNSNQTGPSELMIIDDILLLYLADVQLYGIMSEWHEAAKVLDSKVGLRNLLRIHNCLSLDCYGDLERMEDKNVPAYSIYHSMLIKWQQKESSDANLQELIQVLRQEDFEDAAVILEEYSKPYGVNSMLDVKWDFKVCDHFTFLGAWDIAEETMLVQEGTELEYWRKVLVIQAQYGADLLPGKGRLEGRIPECWVGLNGKQYSIDGRFKVLAKVNPGFEYRWIQSDRLGNGIPIGSICGGITAIGEKFYVGRAKIHLYGRWIHVPGKIFGSNLKTLYYPYHNKDWETNEFEVLVCTSCSNLL